MRKILTILLTFLGLLTISSCKSCKKEALATPTNLTISEEGLITWDNVANASEYVIYINDDSYNVSKNEYQVSDLTKDFTYYVYAKGTNYLDSKPTDKKVYKAKVKPPVVLDPITIGISGPSEVKSEKSIKLTATVEGTDNKEVTWSIKDGLEYASITQDGTLTAEAVNGDTIIEVIATSKYDSTKSASKIITIVAKPVLTQAMLDALNQDKISFEGYINISLYTIGLFEKLQSTYVTDVKTAMDGTNWFAQYENGDTRTIMSLYYKNNNNKACQVGVSFMNEEEYFPMLDDLGNEVSFIDSGLYNGLKNLTVNDFTFNLETWRYEYTGNDETLPSKVLAAANPYDFVPTGFALIIEENEIMGIYSKSEPDYSLVDGYKGIQELIVTINLGEFVNVPTISKYDHEDIHDELQLAIDNMNALTSYTLDFKEITASYMSSGIVESGFTEYITDTDCYFAPYNVKYDSQLNEIHTYLENASYGYKKINDNLYNTYYQDTDGAYYATRAYKSDFSLAKPTFAFAAEIFRTYYENPEDGTITYYVDDVMSPVASTFYYGVGNDINLYGIFATRGYISTSESFTPYVVVKDGYIIEACFYFYIGSIYGVVELKYDDFNTTTLPDNVEVEFETREVPSSWNELTIEVTSGSDPTTEDEYTANALDYLKRYFENDNIDNELPFFGNALGDTYGFGLTTIYIPKGQDKVKNAIVFYYDVPLDINYTIDSSLKEVESYLLSLGFIRDSNGNFKKGNINIAPTDYSLDLLIYVWKD